MKNEKCSNSTPQNESGSNPPTSDRANKAKKRLISLLPAAGKTSTDLAKELYQRFLQKRRVEDVYDKKHVVTLWKEVFDFDGVTDYFSILATIKDREIATAFTNDAMLQYIKKRCTG